MNSSKVLIVGAGMAGLTAARQLLVRGIESIVLDKGRAPGGRMATRTVGDARFDHGAQHFSARSPQFRAEVTDWLEEGLVGEWYSSASRSNAGRGVEPRHVGINGMRRLPEALAAGLDVRTSMVVERFERVGREVAAIADEGTLAVGAAVILTPPVPQIMQLLESSAITMPTDVESMLEQVEYDACLAAMVHLDGPSGIPDGHLSLADGPIAWVGDNYHKGTSAVPSVTIHSTPDFAATHLEEEAEEWLGLLGKAAAVHLGSQVTELTGHRWRHSRPRTSFDVGAVLFDAGYPVVLAGEVFCDARVEGAYLSGAAAAAQVLEHL